MRIAFLIFIVSTQLSGAIQDEAIVAIESIEDLESRIREALAETSTPGLIGAVVTRDQVVWTYGMGVVNSATGREVDAESVCPLGSISKSLVSLAVLILQERGQLSLDDRVADLLPEIGIVNAWSESAPVRIVNLLEHTAGFDGQTRFFGWAGSESLTLEQGIRRNGRSLLVRWPPGTLASYTNVGPSVAALAVERVTGETYEEFVAREIFRPLGMRSASFYVDESGTREVRSPNRVPVEVPDRPMMLRPSSGLNANASDMARLVRLFLNRGELDGERLVDPVNIARMETPTTGWLALGGVEMGSGLGMQASYANGYKYLGHGGSGLGFRSVYGYLPRHGVGYFFAIDTTNPGVFGRINGLFRSYLTRDIEPDLPPPVVELSRGELDRYQGYYEPATERFRSLRFFDILVNVRVVRAQGNALEVDSLRGAPFLLYPVGDDRLRRASDPAATSLFLQDGNEWFMVTPGETYRRIPAGLAYGRWFVAATTVLLMASAVLFSLVWVPRVAFGRLKRTDLGPRWLPLMATLCLFLALGLAAFAFALGGEIVFAGPTIWWVAFNALTWLFAVASVLALWPIWRTRLNAGGPVWWHSVLVSAANLTALAYLAYSGVIGMRMWP
jgi:CubicO group peptidase (beta-lactamase class C family)